MRFCTTCGRNFEGDLPECPHDGTPLFDMGAPTKEPLLAEASEPWAATSHSEADVSNEIEVDNAEIGVVDLESRSKEFPNPILDDPDPIFADEAPEEDASVEKAPIDLESALFDDELVEPSQSSGGTDDLMVDEIAANEVKIEQKDEVIIDDALAPIEAKSSGGSKLLPILLILILGGAAAFYFVGGGKEMLSRPKKSEPKPKVVATPVKKEAPKVEKKIEKPVVEEKKVEKKPEPKKVEPKKTVEKTPKKKVTPKKVEKVEEKPVVKKKVEKKVEPKKKVTPKKKVVEDPEELLRKELEAMEGN